MLGEALPPEARSGLVLFLGRGMWRWARTLGSVRQEPLSMRRSNPTDAGACSAIIHVFAAMAMEIDNRRRS